MQLAGFSPSLSQLNQLSNALTNHHGSSVASMSPSPVTPSSISSIGCSLAAMSNATSGIYQTSYGNGTMAASGLPSRLQSLSGLNDFSGRQNQSQAPDSNEFGKSYSGSYEHLLLNGSNYFQDYLTSHHRNQLIQRDEKESPPYDNNNVDDLATQQQQQSAI